MTFRTLIYLREGRMVWSLTLIIALGIVIGYFVRVHYLPDLALATRDAYVAGPPAMMPGVVAALENAGIDHEHIHADSFGL